MILSACIPEPENPTIQLSETSQLAQVRDWFEANKTKLRLPDRGTNFRTESQELILPFFEKEPDWDQFHHYYFPDGREVFEVSLENENLYIPRAKDAGASEEDVDYFQNILFVKHPTLPKFDPLIIRYYPDKNTSNREFTEISYEMIDGKWSGWIDLFTYDEHYLMGYKVSEGELTHTRQMQKSPENVRKIAVGSENKDEAIHCYVVATDWYDGRTGEYLDTTHAQTCEWQRGGSRSGYGGYSGGSYGGGGGTDGPGGNCSSCYDPPSLNKPNTFLDFSLIQNPGTIDFKTATQTEIFLHILSHLKMAKKNGKSLDIRSIFSNIPLYGTNGAPINSGVAKIVINGIRYEIFFEYGVKSEWSKIKSFPDFRYKGDNTIWDYYLDGSSSLRGATFIIPNEVQPVFLKNFY
ncbi:hypothetical protein [Algoriphagus marincola]|uniref:hypothetical protein n=1 Tax=Algoriphagus marincola TaxID=264027 RepID=UPI00047C8613|nr:hypothetical protein [Algoriphagus marincola]